MRVVSRVVRRSSRPLDTPISCRSHPARPAVARACGDLLEHVARTSGGGLTPPRCVRCDGVVARAVSPARSSGGGVRVGGDLQGGERTARPRGFVSAAAEAACGLVLRDAWSAVCRSSRPHESPASCRSRVVRSAVARACGDLLNMSRVRRAVDVLGRDARVARAVSPARLSGGECPSGEGGRASEMIAGSSECS